MPSLSALVLSLPTRNSTVRMRVWRALKGTGCGVLRDGVYVLPSDSPSLGAFPEIEAQIHEAGGFAMTADLGVRGADIAHVRALFDRSEAYGELVARIRKAKGSLARLGKRRAATASRRFQRAFEELSAIDFYPGEARAQALNALEAFDAEVRRIHSDGEPRASRGRITRVDPGKFRRRVWATRKAPWVDRLASAWLIKRFIDKDARFAWIDSPRHCPKDAVGFDFDGARFTHVGGRVTFEVLLESFSLDADPALAAIASTIHFLDSGGIPVADARGVETLLRGITQTARSDDERILKAGGVFDHLYAAYSGS